VEGGLRLKGSERTYWRGMLGIMILRVEGFFETEDMGMVVRGNI